MPDSPEKLLRRIRLLLAFVVFGLVASGLTAFPLESEAALLVRLLAPEEGPGSAPFQWLSRVHEGLAETNRRFPFLAYGTDWLAFAHLVIAVLFLGPLRDPVRNVWVIQLGLVACAGVPVLALVAGPLRGIPFWWRLVDSSFGVACGIPLLLCLRHVRRLEADGAGPSRS